MEKWYRVTWRMDSALTGTWIDAAVVGGEEVLDQYRQLKGWSETGEEPVKDVKLFELTVQAVEVDHG
jgi:hypothetical protein